MEASSKLDNETGNDLSATDNSIAVGRMVNVKARTWPGINKPGGIAKVTKVHGNADSFACIDVRYTLGGGETKIPIEYVALAPEYERFHENKKLRDRSVILGRCKRCGSLRTDCNFCDWAVEPQIHGEGREKRKRRRKPEPMRSQLRFELSSSSSDENILRLMQKRRGDSKNRLEFDSSSGSSDNYVVAKIIDRNRRRQRGQEPEINRIASPEPRRQIFDGTSASRQLRGKDDEIHHSTPLARETDELDINSHSSSGGEFVGTQDLSPLKNSQTIIHYYSTPENSPTASTTFPDSLNQNDLEGFIQPEGAADQLPEDIVDLTCGLSLLELPIFFEEHLERLRDCISDGRVELANLKRQRKDGNDGIDFEKKSATLFDALVAQLLRNCRDQCRIALLKMNRLYRKEKANLSKSQRKQLRMDARDLALDRVSEEAEDLVREARQVYHSFLLSRQEKEDEDMSFGDDDRSSENSGVEMVISDEIENLGATTVVVPDAFDPHMHARRVKKKELRYNRRHSRPQNSNKRLGLSRYSKERSGKEFSTGNVMVISGLQLERARNGFPDDENTHRKRMKNYSFKYCANTAPLSSAPQLDDRHSFTADLGAQMSRQYTSRVPRESRRKDISVVNRMEAFLKANPSDFDERSFQLSDDNPFDLKGNDHRLSRAETHPSETRSLRRRHEQTSSIQSPCLLSRESFTKSLYQNMMAFTSDASTSHGPISHSQDTQLLHSKADPVILMQKLTELCNLADSNTLLRPQTLRAFQLVVEIYQVIGIRTLQEVIATEPELLPIHETLLLATFRLLGTGSQMALVLEDGIVFKLFTESNPSSFIASITLQLLDSWYAVLHPVAWAMEKKGGDQSSVTNTLQEICKGLRKITSGISLGAFLLLNKFSIQQWRKSVNTMCFVSSVDPQQFKKLLQTGISGDDSMPSRLSIFGEHVPRHEIELIWTILGLFAGTSIHHNDSQSHWRLAKLLFTSKTGVLSEKVMENQMVGIFPSEEHLLACETELCYFRTLLSSNALDPLPQTDGFFRDLIRSSLILHSKASAVFRSTTDVNIDEQYLLWSQSDPIRCDARIGSEGTIINLLCLDPQITIEQICHELINSYSAQLPSKRARLSRFFKMMQLLGSELRRMAYEVENNPVHAVHGDTFANAFGVNRIAERDISPCSFVLIESAANMTVCLTKAMLYQQRKSGINIFDPFPFNRSLAEELWDAIADAEMKVRRLDMDRPEMVAIRPYMGSSLRLNSASRIMSNLVLFDGKGIDDQSLESATNLTTFEVDAHCLEFAVSCLLVCMNCACSKLHNMGEHFAQPSEEEESLALLHRLASLISSILLQVRSQVVASAGAQIPYEIVRKLADICFRISQSCLESVVKISNIHNLGDTAFRSCLTMVRHCVTLSIINFQDGAPPNEVRSQRQTGQSPNIDSSGEDFLGDLDDSAFLDICVAGDEMTANSIYSGSRLYSATFSFLANLLVAAKPSCRFLLTSISNLSTSASSAGKILISRQSGAICSCLAALSTLLSADTTTIDQFLCSINAGIHKDENDCLYLKSVEQCFYSEICRLAAAHQACEKFINQHREEALCSFFAAAFDSAAIERFPSCNLERFKKLSGQRGYEKEKLRLQQSNRLGGMGHVICRKSEEVDEAGPIYNANNIWAFSKHLGTIFCKSESVGWKEIGQLLSNAQFIDASISLSNIQCLEREVLLRIKLSCSFLLSTSITDYQQDVWIDFDKINIALVSYCSMNLVAIAEGLDYQSRAISSIDCNLEKPLHTHKGAKLATLQTCYSELTICVLCATCCRMKSQSDLFRNFANDIRNSFLGPLLSHGTFDVYQGLQRLANKYQNNTSMSQKKFLTLGNDLVSSCLRRSREYVLSICLSSNPAGSVALISVLGNTRLGCCVDDAAVMIANSFFPRRRRVAISVDGSSGILSHDVDKVLSMLDQLCVETSSFLQLLHFVAGKVIAPKLQSDGLAQKVKTGTLQVLDHIFRMARDDMMLVFPADLLCRLAKSLWVLVKDTISSEMMDENLLATSLKCSSRLLNQRKINETNSHHFHERTVLSWSSDVSKQYRREGTQFDETTDHVVLHTCFLSAFAEALHAVSIFIKNSIEGSRNLNELLKAIIGEVVSSGDEIITLVESSRKLNHLEKLLFFDKENSSPLIKNVYIKPKAIVNPVSSCKEWIPSAHLCRSAKDFIAVFTTQCTT